MQAARNKDDLLRAIDATDTPDWISTLPDGQTLKHADVIRELETMLTVPPEKRGSPHLDFIYWNETAASTTVLYWVYGERDGRVIGSIARDTWVRTRDGWRRSRHEKFLPERPLIDHGKPVILPPLADHLP